LFEISPLDEIEQLRNLCDTLRTDKIQLQAQIDDFQCEKAALAVFFFKELLKIL